MLSALEKAKHVIIGVCTPEICTDEEAERTGYPCAPHMNPFSYQERCEMIDAALADAGVEKERYSFLSFPSDYKNIEILLPNDAILFISVTGKGDQDKIDHLRGQGISVETILSLTDGEKKEGSGHIRTRAAGWQQMIPAAVQTYLELHDLPPKL